MKTVMLVLKLAMLLVSFAIADHPRSDIKGHHQINSKDVQVLSEQWLVTMAGTTNFDINKEESILEFSLLAENLLAENGNIKLVINEFVAKNDGFMQDENGDYDDWIEIYNYGNNAVDIGGMYLTDDLSQPTKWRIPENVPSITTIAGHSYLLIWADDETSEGPLHASFKLDASGEEIGLFGIDGQTLIDGITFGPQIADESYGRYPDASDNWQILKSPTPARPNKAEPIQVVINEIMYHPYHSLYEPELLRLEYIELLNLGTEPVSLYGWRFTDGIDFTFTNDVILGGGQYLVVAADINAFSEKYPDVKNVIGGWHGHLSNSGEAIELVDDNGTRIDRVHYADQGDWAVRELGPLDFGHRGWVWSDEHDGLGKSLELVNPALGNEYGQNWAVSDANDGTPGVANSAASDNIAPLILDVAHFPVIPDSDEPVAVTARIVDEASFGITVTLHYRVDSSVYEEGVYPHYDPNGYSMAVMFDDGAHGDGDADDGVYGARIPAQFDGTIVEFYVEASDSGAGSRTWPAPSFVDGEFEQVTNALYQVNDLFDPDAMRVPGSWPVYYIIMTAAELGELDDIGDRNYQGDIFAAEPMSNAQMNITFISIDGVGTEVRYNVGVRNRGNRKRANPPMSYRVNFRHDQPWEQVTALNLNSKYPHLELMGSILYQMADLPAADVTIVRLNVNGQEPALSDFSHTYGFYSAVEVLDANWADKHFPDDSAGNLYRCTYYSDGVHPRTYADLDYKEDPGQTPDPNDYRLNYPKQTNESADDWSDLFILIDKLNNNSIPDSDFVSEVSKVLDLEKWMRYFAVDAMIGNREGSLATGIGDDYAMYRGVIEPRFKLIPHDIDTILGRGDQSYQPQRSIFVYDDVDGLRRLFRHPDVVKLYYKQYHDLAETVFAPANFDPLVDYLLGNWISSSEINGSSGIKQFIKDRANNILYGGYPQSDDNPQIPQDFTITAPQRTADDYTYTNHSAVTFSGTANAIKTRSVCVNGLIVPEFNWSQRNGTWSIDDIILKPGINRVIVQAFDEPKGSGNEIHRMYTDIYYDDGDFAEISGTLAADMSLDSDSGPWLVTDDLIVPEAVTLTIELGTTVFFETDTRMTINGRLIAEGTQYRLIRFTRTPGTNSTWNGLQFINSSTDNRITYAVVEYGRADDGMIGLENSNLLLEYVTLDNTDLRRIRSLDSSLIVRNCVFTDIFGPDQLPSTDNRSEHIWGSGVPEDGMFVIENNIFGTTKGHNDLIDFDGPSRPNPIVQILNNIFLGGGDDALDLEADAHIEGNVFMHFHRDSYNTAVGHSNAISAGRAKHYVVVRNVFYDFDHVMFVKDDAFVTFVNNTVADVDISALYFDLQGHTTSPGLGAYLDGNIFWDMSLLFDEVTDATDLAVNHSIIPSEFHYLGQGNIDADPLFVDPNDDFNLKLVSPAIGTGPWGLDMGAYVPSGAAICGEPSKITYRNEAALTVGGPGITHYKWSLNDPNGPWSEEQPIDMPIELMGLVNGQSYTVYILGKNSAGIWQEIPTASQTWTVDSSSWRLVINEVLARNESVFEQDGIYPDLVELYYDGPVALDLSGMSITDDKGNPDKFVFASGTTIEPGQHMVIYVDANAVGPGIYLGFALSGNGEGVYLHDNSGELLDSVEFGLQLPDLSIGRVGYNGKWHLTVPTFGGENFAQPLSDPDMLKINEWFTNGQVLFEDDFIELYNPNVFPVDLSGLYLTDNPVTQPGKDRLGPLSFISGEGFATFTADDSNNPGHVTFRLSPDGEMIGLFDAKLNAIDKVIYGPQTTDVSQGRAPDGSDKFEFFELPTPGVGNPAGTIVNVSNLVAIDHVWSYEQTDTALPATWIEPDYDDSSWPAGPALLYVENSELPAPKNTELTLGAMTYYFRTHFNLSFAPGDITQLELNCVIDDGAVFYLNGHEVLRLGMAEGEIEHTMTADRTVSNADYEGPFVIPIDYLLEGNNVIAVEVHQTGSSSSDIVFGLELDAVVMTSDDSYADAYTLLDGLRITELMYHAADGSDFDYIELQNINDVTLDLTGVRIAGGVDFVFGEMVLGPGEYVVVVSSLSSFRSKYGSDINVAGDYSGNLSNNGEQIVLNLAFPLDAAILRFSYDSSWYPTTDGGGDSLVVTAPSGAVVSWQDSAGWQPSIPTPGQP